MLHYSAACERNKRPIAAQLGQYFADCQQIIEVGSGSGQHADYFARQWPHLTWQPTDFDPYFTDLVSNLEHGPHNLLPPQRLSIESNIWINNQTYDGLFSANTLHIMPWQQVETFFQRSANQLVQEAKLGIYGPFKYKGQFTSDSNAEFDQMLRSRATGSAIRDIEMIIEQAHRHQFTLLADIQMPAHNQLLIFHKVATAAPEITADSTADYLMPVGKPPK